MAKRVKVIFGACLKDPGYHESDGVVIKKITDDNGFRHEITRCKRCQVRLSKPIKNQEWRS